MTLVIFLAGMAAVHLLTLDIEYHEVKGGSAVRALERGIRASDSIVNQGFIR